MRSTFITDDGAGPILHCNKLRGEACDDGMPARWVWASIVAVAGLPRAANLLDTCISHHKIAESINLLPRVSPYP